MYDWAEIQKEQSCLGALFAGGGGWGGGVYIRIGHETI